MFKKINHVGIAVKDLNRFINIFAGKLDLKLGKVEEVKKGLAKYRVAFSPIGEADIEFVQSSEGKGIIGDYIGEVGGEYHIALEVGN